MRSMPLLSTSDKVTSGLGSPMPWAKILGVKSRKFNEVEPGHVVRDQFSGKYEDMFRLWQSPRLPENFSTVDDSQSDCVACH